MYTNDNSPVVFIHFIFDIVTKGKHPIGSVI